MENLEEVAKSIVIPHVVLAYFIFIMIVELVADIWVSQVGLHWIVYIIQQIVNNQPKKQYGLV